MKPSHLLPRHAAPLVDEHATLCRQLGGLQRRVSDLLMQHENEIRRLDRETVRLRGQLMVARTAMLWGMPGSPTKSAAGDTVRKRPVGDQRTPSLPEAREVLCQVACTGHAHPWLNARGHCSRDGKVCTHVLD
jgi:hypothetical protein